MGLKVSVGMTVEALDGTTIAESIRVTRTFNALPGRVEDEPALALAALGRLQVGALEEIDAVLSDWAEAIRRAVEESKADARRALEDDRPDDQP